MIDILNRNIKDYDLVVGKGTGRYVHGMSLGVWLGKSMFDADGSRRSMSDVYLIENPTEKELEIKNVILEKIKAKEEEANKKKSAEYISPSKLIRGGIYQTYDGISYLFLGKNSVKLYSKRSLNNSWKLSKEKSGNCFVWIPKTLNNIEDNLKPFKLVNYYGNDFIFDILKTSKKFTKFIKQIKVEDNFELTDVVNLSHGGRPYVKIKFDKIQ